MTETYRDPNAAIDDRVADLLGRMTLEEKVAQLGTVWLTALVQDEAFDPDHAAEQLADGIGQVTRIGASTGLLANESAQLGNDIQQVLVERTRLGIPAVIHEEGVGGFLHRGATTFPQGLGLAATWDVDLMAEVAEVIRTQMTAVGARHNLSPVLDVARDPRWGRVEETYGESPELCARMGVAYVKGLQTDDLANGVVCTGKHFLGYGYSLGGRNQAPVHLGDRELREVYAEPFAAAIREAGLASIMNSYSSIDGVPVAASRAMLTDLLRGELGFAGTVVADYFAVMQLHFNHMTAADPAESAIQALSAGLDIELPALDCYKHLPAAVREGRIDESIIDESCARVLAQKIQLGLFENPYVDAGAALAVFDTPDQRALARRAAAEGVILLKNDGVLPLNPSISKLAVIGPHADDPRLLQGDYHYPAHLEIIYQNRSAEMLEAMEALGLEQGVDQLPEAGGTFSPGPHFTPHVTPLDGLRAALPDAEVIHAVGCADTGEDESGIDEAVAAAASADVAIVCVGARSGLVADATVGEARDATDLGLPGVQSQLVARIAATGTPMVVVVISGRVHTLEAESAAANALIWSILPGEEGGSAIAQVLTGEVNPSGRLPVTLPLHVGQIPLHHDMRRRGDRSEFYGSYVDCDTDALYWFGHGLSYTTFEYGEPSVVAGSTTEVTTISVPVANKGQHDGDEVVQLYATDEVASVARPIRELIGFARVAIPAGETRTVTFTVHPSRLSFHGLDMALATEPGTFTFRIGGSSLDPNVREATVELTGDTASYDRRSIIATAVDIS
ncbi:MAG: beta-glucosidase [Acidimicrobiia bacterium]|nr:beta-glucosidase [Acidimicrobiia bacterium]MYB75189.1 beta-glucosidase [Acidimicrobiia bacterium]MYI00679.1 beta-glucosidase [Acidimicrobiia bacterium]